MRMKAFTLTEVLVAVAIMSIMAGVMSLNSATVGQQTAKREAERVAAFIQGHINRENIARRGLWFKVNDDNIQVGYGFSYSLNILQDTNFKASTGCTYAAKTQQLRYRVTHEVSDWLLISDDSTVVTGTGTNKQLYITVTGANNKTCDVIIGRNL